MVVALYVLGKKKKKKAVNNTRREVSNILDIKQVQVKGNMLFSETEGSFKDHYEMVLGCMKKKDRQNLMMAFISHYMN